MPVFLEEDGTGVEDATSYVSIAFADDYLGPTWLATDELKEIALMGGSEYADARWGKRIRSQPLVTTQGLEFPRYGLCDRYGRELDPLPAPWKRAVCLYAQEYSAGTLYPSSPTNPKDVKKKKTVVGPITTEIEYQGASVATSWLKFTLADEMVKQYLAPTGGGVMRN